MSWHYLQDQAEEYSEDICLDGKPWRPAKSKITHERHYYGDKLTEFYLDSLSGMTSEHSMDLSFGEVSISFQEDSPVRISPQPGKALESMAFDLDCGRKCTGSLAKYDHDSHSWKTLHYSLLGDLEPFSGTWPKSGTMRNGVCWERMTSERHIEGNGSGYWPTPTSSTGGPEPEGKTGRKLATAVQWPTPTRSMYKGTSEATLTRKSGKSREKDRIDHAVLATVLHGGTKTRQTWPTPSAQEAGIMEELTTKDGKPAKPGQRAYNPKTGKHTQVTTGRAVAMTGEKSGQLNPSWVEWLMGWPIGWTALKPLGMDKFRQQWQQRF